MKKIREDSVDKDVELIKMGENEEDLIKDDEILEFKKIIKNPNKYINNKIDEGEENEESIDKDKHRLLERLEDIKSQIGIKGKKTVKDVYLSYSEVQIMENKEIKKAKISKISSFFYKLILFIMTSIYLVGAFLTLSLKNSFWNLFVSSLKCRFNKGCNKEEFKKRANFFFYFHLQLLKEPPDFNLIMFWNFIGIKLTNLIGLRPSMAIILLVNIVIFFTTYIIYYEEYDKETCQYSFLMIIALFFNWTFMAIGFGASSLLAQQKFIDYFSLLDDYLNEDQNLDSNNPDVYQTIQENSSSNSNEDSSLNSENNDFDFLYNSIENIFSNMFEILTNRVLSLKNQINKLKVKRRTYKTLFLLGVANILGLSGKFEIGKFFANYRLANKIIKNETIYDNITDSVFFINDNYFYTNNSNKNQTYLINDLDKSIYLYICIIYICCVLISIMVIYSLIVCCFFEKKAKEKENNNEIEKSGCCKCDCKCNCCVWKIVCEICGCIFYFERIFLDKDETNNNRCCQLCCESMNNYCDNIICNMCNCREKDRKNYCCYKFDKSHFDKEKQCFCYCFQVKSFCYWLNQFFMNDAQKEIIVAMIIYLISRLSVIACEKNYEDTLLNNNYYLTLSSGIIFIIILFMSIILFISAVCSEKKCMKIFDENNNFGSNLRTYISIIFNKVIIWFKIILALVVNFGFGFFYSYYNLLTIYQSPHNEKLIETTRLIDLMETLFINAFLFFLLNFYCLITAKSQTDFEFLFSPTIIITIYNILIEFFIYLIKKLIQDIYILLLIQLIITFIVLLILIIIIIPAFIKSLYLTIIKCCGQELCKYENGINTCKICCCNENNRCYSDCCYLRCSECDCSYLFCEKFCYKLSYCIFRFFTNNTFTND